jgi:hypothetical protein
VEEGKAGTATIMMIDHDSFLICTLFRHPFNDSALRFLAPGMPRAISNKFFTRASAEGFIWILEIIGLLANLRQRPSLLVGSDGRLAEVNSKLNGGVSGYKRKPRAKIGRRA